MNKQPVKWTTLIKQSLALVFTDFICDSSLPDEQKLFVRNNIDVLNYNDLIWLFKEVNKFLTNNTLQGLNVATTEEYKEVYGKLCREIGVAKRIRLNTQISEMSLVDLNSVMDFVDRFYHDRGGK